MASTYKDLTNNYSPVPAMLQYAKKEISNHPEIFIGNLQYWIKKRFPRSNSAEMNQVFQQLVEEGYLFFLGEVYPPHISNENDVTILKFVYNNNLSEIDQLILHQIKTYEYTKLNSLSKDVADLGGYEEEDEIKIAIQLLFMKKIVIVENNYLAVNWDLIMGCIG